MSNHTVLFSYEDLMFGEDEEEDRPGIKAKKKVNETVSLLTAERNLIFDFVLCRAC